jgi:hypothetical protein
MCDATFQSSAVPEERSPRTDVQLKLSLLLLPLAASRMIGKLVCMRYRVEQLAAVNASWILWCASNCVL